MNGCTVWKKTKPTLFCINISSYWRGMGFRFKVFVILKEDKDKDAKDKDRGKGDKEKGNRLENRSYSNKSCEQ